MPQLKPNKQKRKMTITRRPVLIVIIILVIAIITLVITKILINSAANSVNQTNDSTPEANTNTNTNTNNQNNIQADSETTSNKTPQQYEGPNANTYETLTGAITYAEVSGTDLIIRTTIDQELSTSATCNLTVTNGVNSITEASGIINNPSSSSCEGFTIPTSRLSSGTWQLEIKINSGGKTGTITGEATI